MSEKAKKHMLNSPKIRLQAPCPSAKGKFSYMSWDVWMNNPRIVVSTNDPALMVKERGFGRIQAAMEPPTFGVFLEMLNDAINATEAWKNLIKCFGKDPNGGFEPVHKTDIWVGKDAEGCVFASVISKEEGWPSIKFVFGAPDERYHQLFHGNGTAFTKSEISIKYAKAYYDMLKHAMYNVLDTHYVEPPPYIPGQQNGKGSYGGGGGGGYNKPANAGGGAPRASGGGEDADFSDLAF